MRGCNVGRSLSIHDVVATDFEGDPTLAAQKAWMAGWFDGLLRGGRSPAGCDRSSGDAGVVAAYRAGLSQGIIDAEAVSRSRGDPAAGGRAPALDLSTTLEEP
jgi:hypothetical protein